MNWDLVTIFSFVVVLVAIRSHYSHQKRSAAAGFGTGDQSALTRAMDMARRLEQRVDTLERLLDEDAPGWRARARA